MYQVLILSVRMNSKLSYKYYKDTSRIFFTLFSIFILLEAYYDPTVIEGSISYTSIQEAINAANPGDTVLVSPGIYYEDLIINKSIILKSNDPYSTIICGKDSDTIITIKANGVIIEGLTIRPLEERSKIGVYIRSVNSCIVTSSFFENCDVAVKLDNSFNNEVYKCSIKNCNVGIKLWYFSCNNSFYENKIISNSVGVDLRAYSFASTVSSNVIVNNSIGIYVSHSHDNKFKRNVIGENSFCGIYLYGVLSKNNLITLNNITRNKYGMYLWLSESNLIYRNNFIDNKNHVYIVLDSYDCPNEWNASYPEGGNFWSGYLEKDEFRGRFQNVTGSDGIIDKPYIISKKNVDYYPFVYPIKDLTDYSPESKYDFMIALIIVVILLSSFLVGLKLKRSTYKLSP